MGSKKASGVKLSNKKNLKLAKRGQLDHQKKRKKEALRLKKRNQYNRKGISHGRDFTCLQ